MCITTVSYRVNVIGKQTRVIRPSRGLSQGDHPSPYLFIIIVDVLSRMMESQVERGRIEGVRPKQGCPTLYHLFFADDSLFFIKGTTQRAKILKRILHLYCLASGHTINLNKSNLFFSGATDERLRSVVASILGVRYEENLGHYLGLPTIWGRSRREAMNYVKERVQDKINGWRNKLNNNAGK